MTGPSRHDANGMAQSQDAALGFAGVRAPDQGGSSPPPWTPC